MLRMLNAVVCAVLIALVRVYKVVLSPLLGDCCRFEPTCSAYCVEALRTHGALRGLWLTVRRLLRCRPFGPSGYDPVPPRKTLSQRRRDAEAENLVNTRCPRGSTPSLVRERRAPARHRARLHAELVFGVPGQKTKKLAH